MTAPVAVLRCALAVLTLAAAVAMPSGAAAAVDGQPAAAAPLWVYIDDGPAGLADSGRALAVNPVNGTVNVTGFSARSEPRPGRYRNYDYATVSYGLLIGDLRRRTVDASPGDPAPGGSNDDFATDIGVDVSSGRLFVTGTSEGSPGSGTDFATVAYSPAGARLWSARFPGPGSATAAALAVDPATGNVYVTGYGVGVGGRADFFTVAYSSAGSQLWVARYNHSGDGGDFPTDIAVGPDGTVFVTGSSTVDIGFDVQDRIVTVAYHPDGRRRWLVEYDTDGNDRPSALAIDPESGTAYVAGFIGGTPSNAADAVTLAYGPSGVTLWVAAYDGPDESVAVATDLAVVPGGTVFVTGTVDSATSTSILMLGYDPAGASLFTDVPRLPGRNENNAVAVAVDPVRAVAYVAGSTRAVRGIGNYDVATLAYDETGRQLRVDVYDAPVFGSDTASDIAVDARTGLVYVSGRTDGLDADGDYLTLAYAGV